MKHFDSGVIGAGQTMDEERQECGVTDLPRYPLVTFALLAYNQQDFIREAVETALAQEYPCLEIIISDDNSTDGTWDAIQSAVANYRGPHRVVIQRTKSNSGVLQHVMAIAALATGKLLVLAAGDDISKPERTARLVSAWLSTDAWGLCSKYDRIDAEGRILEHSVVSNVLDGKSFKKYFYDEEGPISIVHGCTSAYDVRVFSNLVLASDDFILSEDGALSVLLNLLGKKIFHLDESLVLYREHSNSLTNGRSATAMDWSRLVHEEDKIAWFAQAQANRCRFFLRLNDELESVKVRSLKLAPVRRDLEHLERRAAWWNFSFFERLALLPGFIGYGDGKWAFARIFGRSYFLVTKFVFSQVRHVVRWRS